ncbi:MAG TPA: cbb3-type cytochrome oxidase assembly protein CcoS [bacterium]|jgi:cbb3-type cytochrome oxidase maturation protein
MGLEILYLLIPVTFVLAAIALMLFVWAIHSGQFDDLETPAIRVLFDDGPGPRSPPAEGVAAAPDDEHPPRKRTE